MFSSQERCRDFSAACSEFPARRYHRKTRTERAIEQEPLFSQSHYAVQNDDLPLFLTSDFSEEALKRPQLGNRPIIHL